MFSPRSLAVVLLVVLEATTSSKAADSKDSKVKFASVVQSHYSGWTEGTSDGKLCRERVAELVDNPDVRGDEAMAIASIHHFLRMKTAPKDVDEKFLLDPKNAGGHEGRRDQQSNQPDFQKIFDAFRAHLKSVPHTLFGKGARSGPESVRDTSATAS